MQCEFDSQQNVANVGVRDEDDDEDTKRQIAQKQKQLQVFRVHAGMLGRAGAYVGAG